MHNSRKHSTTLEKRHSLSSSFNIMLQYFKTSQTFPKVNFQSLPALSNARWNSRAIYTLVAFILMPEFWQKAEAACDFTSGTWSNIWFSAQFFNPADFNHLSEACQEHPKALKSLRKFWST